MLGLDAGIREELTKLLKQLDEERTTLGALYPDRGLLVVNDKCVPTLARALAPDADSCDVLVPIPVPLPHITSRRDTEDLINGSQRWRCGRVRPASLRREAAVSYRRQEGCHAHADVRTFVLRPRLFDRCGSL